MGGGEGSTPPSHLQCLQGGKCYANTRVENRDFSLYLWLLKLNGILEVILHLRKGVMHL